MARDLFPDVLPYVIGTPATYGFAARNGRSMADNAPEAMLSLVTNMAVPSGLKPSVAQSSSETATFPTSCQHDCRGCAGLTSTRPTPNFSRGQ